MDSSPPGSSVHGISQARILEWVAISFSKSQSPSSSHPLFLLLVSMCFFLCVCVCIFCFANRFICTIFLDPIYMQYLFFSLWLISLCMPVSRSIHVSASGLILFLFMTNIPCVCVCVCHIFFIHSSFDGHLGCVAIVNSGAMNTGVQESSGIMVVSGICPRVGLQGHMALLFLVF